MPYPTLPSRRALIVGAALLPIAGDLTTSAADASTTDAPAAGRPAYGTVSPNASNYTGAVGRKFYIDGRTRPFPGCTMVSHVQPDTPLQKALFEILDEAAAAPVMKKFTLMPKSSLHMTLMDGIDDEHRRAPLWPRDVPVTASLQDCIEWCSAHLKDFRTGRTGDYQMVRREIGIDKLNSFTVHLKPISVVRDQEMRHTRDRLSETLQIRSPDHDRFGFHITLGYLVEYLTEDEARVFFAQYNRWMDNLFAALPCLTLGQPEFCTFRDMSDFTRQFYLQD